LTRHFSNSNTIRVILLCQHGVVAVCLCYRMQREIVVQCICTRALRQCSRDQFIALRREISFEVMALQV